MKKFLAKILGVEKEIEQEKKIQKSKQEEQGQDEQGAQSQFLGIQIHTTPNPNSIQEDKDKGTETDSAENTDAEFTKKSSIEKIKVQTIDERVQSLKHKALIIIVGLVGLIFLGYSLKDMIVPFFNKKAKEEQQQKVKLIEPPKDAKRGEIVDTRALEQDWKTLIEKRITEQDKALTDISKKLEDISGKLEKKEKPEIERSKEKNSKQEMPPVPPPMPAGQQGVMQPPVKPETQPVFRSIEFKKSDKDRQSKTTETSKTDTINLPMGITVGLTITGMDAPTFQWGQQEPQPMLISIESALITAGGKEIPLKNCMALASGYGAVSSEKAMLRLVSMNCRDKNGNLFAGNVEGWVLGDDGKVGITGRLVSRQGSVIAKSFWADVLSLGGSALRATATTTAISPLGSLETTTKDSDIWKSAAGQAIERTTGRIAQFFIKIAEQIYPVIEVQPGRKVTVLVKHGSLKKVTQDNFIDIVASSQNAKDAKDKEEKK